MCAGFTSVGCYTLGNGNVDDGAKCTGSVLKHEWVDWETCQKQCYENSQCKGLQFSGKNDCTQYSSEPTAQPLVGSHIHCMKKVQNTTSLENYEESDSSAESR